MNSCPWAIHFWATFVAKRRRKICAGNCRFLYIDKVQFISRFIIFSSSKLPTCFVSKNISLFITTIIIGAITTKIVCIHFVSGVMFIFSCIIFINKWKIIVASILLLFFTYTHVWRKSSGITLRRKLITYMIPISLSPYWYVPGIQNNGKCHKDQIHPKMIDSLNQLLYAPTASSPT